MLENKKESKQQGISLAVEIIIGLVVVGLIGVLIWRYQVATNGSTANTQDVDIAEVDTSGLKTIEEIRLAAIESAGSDSEITNIELESEDGVLMYVVRFNNRETLRYNAQNGTLIVDSEDSTADDENDDDIPSGFRAGITVERAVSIAKNKRPGIAINKIELESEDGVVVYSVRFADGGRVDVNASNGNVVRVRAGDSSGGSTSGSRSDSSDDDDDNSGSGSNSGSSSDDDDEDDEEDDEDDDDENSGSGSGSDDD